MKKFIYLAGPITDHSFDDANNWRDILQEKFLPGIVAVSPLRGEPKPESGVYTPTDNTKFRNSKAIAAKNHYDTYNCDAVIAYLPKAYNDIRPSYGTIFELGWATGIQTPTILITDDKRLIEHPLIQAKVNWILGNFEDAADIINTLFGIYVK
jgi:nucleoside 2-deoxyribosyltransferase